MSEVRKILIIRLSSIGDIVLTTPLVRSVRKKYPEAQIDYAVKEVFADLVKDNPHIDSVLAFDHKKGFKGLLQFRKLIKSTGYDLIIDIHKNFRSLLLRSLSGARIARYKKHILPRVILVKTGINLYKDPEPVWKRYFHAVKDLDIEPDNAGSEIILDRHTKKQTATTLELSGLDKKQRLILLCPGAGFSNKRWLPERFAETGDYLSKKYACMVGLLGGTDDAELCAEIQSKMVERAVNFAGRFDLPGSSALISASSLVITNDTGLMHIAQALKRPVVAVFGPTVKELGYYPMPENSFVIEKDVRCRPCSHTGMNRCPKKHFRCMTEISSGEVISAAEQLLNSQLFISDERHGQNLVSTL